jgi:outer membrane protein OmpA-like peptidoglycan-associated protein
MDVSSYRLLLAGSFTAVLGLATSCLDFAPGLRQSSPMHTKNLAVALCVLSLAGCQTAPRYQASLPPAYPPPPAHVAPRPAAPQTPKPALPSYSKPTAPFVAANTGHYMDEMEHDLRRILHGVPVGRPGDALVLTFRSDAIFDRDGALSASGRNTLQALAVALRHYDHTLVEINGYTDTRLAQDESVKVSQRHADAVAAELRTDGVDAHRITAAGLGAAHLKIATGEGMNEPRNRRIEIRIAPLRTG